MPQQRKRRTRRTVVSSNQATDGRATPTAAQSTVSAELDRAYYDQRMLVDQHANAIADLQTQHAQTVEKLRRALRETYCDLLSRAETISRLIKES